MSWWYAYLLLKDSVTTNQCECRHSNTQKPLFKSCNMTKFVFLLGLLELVLAGDYSVTKYKFLGLRNVWHTGTQNHIVRYFVEKYLPRYLI